MRYIILTDKNKNVLISQTLVKYKKRCEDNFNAKELGLDYYITVSPKDTAKPIPSDYDYLNWSKDFNLVFVGRDSSIRERMDNNIRVLYVGN